MARIAEAAGILFIVDNTMATPYLCRPIEWGADIVIHSTTKFLGGHGNSMGGAVVDSGTFDWSKSPKYRTLTEPEPAYHGLRFFETFGDLALTMHGHAVGLRDLGATMAPMNAFLTITGIETLPLRMERHVANAQVVAEYLAAHPAVSWVSYAGLRDNPYRALAQRYLPKGAGSVFTFGLKGGYAAGVKLVEGLEALFPPRQYRRHALAGDPSRLDHAPPALGGTADRGGRRSRRGAAVDRLETVSDLIADLERALAA